MEEIITLANRIGGVSFATLLIVILYGSWKHVWVWGRDVEDMKARHQSEKQAIIDDRDWWRDVATRATGIAETQGQLLRVKETKVNREIDDLNRRLIE